MQNIFVDVELASHAVIITECYNLRLKNVAINATVGVGLTALNVLGYSYLTTSSTTILATMQTLPKDKKFHSVAGSVIFHFFFSTPSTFGIYRYFSLPVVVLSEVMQNIFVDVELASQEYNLSTQRQKVNTVKTFSSLAQNKSTGTKSSDSKC